jgi:hypothetical protein
MEQEANGNNVFVREHAQEALAANCPAGEVTRRPASIQHAAFNTPIAVVAHKDLVMVAAPWYLLAVGILLVIVGYFIGRLGGRRSRVYISPKMSDEQIERLMSQTQGNPLAGLFLSLGYLIVFISIAWRLVRLFVS